MAKKTTEELWDITNGLYNNPTVPIGPHLSDYQNYQYTGLLSIIFPNLADDEESMALLDKHVETCITCSDFLHTLRSDVEWWEAPERQIQLSFLRERLILQEGPFDETTIEGQTKAVEVLLMDNEFQHLWDFVDPTLYGFHPKNSGFIGYSALHFDEGKLQALEKHFANCKHCTARLVGLLEAQAEWNSPEGKERIKRLRWDLATQGIDPETPEGQKRLSELGLTTFEEFE